MAWLFTRSSRKARISAKNTPLKTSRFPRTCLGLECLEGRDVPTMTAVGPVFGDLDILLAPGPVDVALPEELEESPGGYVPLNNDNDNYNFTPEGTAIIDSGDTGGVAGENDLIPLRMRAIQPALSAGNYYLVFNNARIRIWMNADKTGEVSSYLTRFEPETDTTVFVEGLTVSPAAAAEKVELVWFDPQGYGGWILDQVKLTVYSVTGPTDVPGHAAYTYTATVPGGTVGSWTASGGTVQAGANTNVASILWGGGPVVGKASFTPVAGLGFTVDREVNVVKVSLDVQGTNSLKYANPNAANGLPPNPAFQDPSRRGVWSANGAIAHAMTATIQVLEIKGPLDNRGVRYIDMGFIQNLQVERTRTEFGTIRKQVVSKLEGDKWYLDMITGPMRGLAPWYDSLNQGQNPAAYAYQSYNPDRLTNVTFRAVDTPATVTFPDMIPAIHLDGHIATRFGLKLNFMLYFAVHTKQDVNGSDKVYTQRAKADWSFVGDGQITRQLGPNYGRWTPSVQRANTGKDKFAEVTDGTRVPVTEDPVYNDIVGDHQFETKPLPGQSAQLNPGGTVTVAGGTGYNFSVAYDGDTPVQVTSLGDGDIRVTGLDGFTALATLVGFDQPADGSPLVATYRITPPGGSWNARDNGNYTVMVEPNQVQGVSGEFVPAMTAGEFTVDVPPVAQSMVVGDGSTQRSVVRDLTVTFDSVVTFLGTPAAAFQLMAVGPGGQPVGFVNLAVDLSASTANQTVARLTFPGNDGLTEFGSLKNGNYALKVLAAQVVGSTDLALDGDHDGVAGGDGYAALFRLFGDGEGDRDVDTTDMYAFYGTYTKRAGDPGYLYYYDFDNDGDVDTVDMNALIANFGSQVPPV